jgi:hypothetical protein
MEIVRYDGFDDPTFENERKPKTQERARMVIPSYICYA